MIFGRVSSRALISTLISGLPFALCVASGTFFSSARLLDSFVSPPLAALVYLVCGSPLVTPSLHSDHPPTYFVFVSTDLLLRSESVFVTSVMFLLCKSDVYLLVACLDGFGLQFISLTPKLWSDIRKAPQATQDFIIDYLLCFC